jgi:hypothetical protein
MQKLTQEQRPSKMISPYSRNSLSAALMIIVVSPGHRSRQKADSCALIP